MAKLCTEDVVALVDNPQITALVHHVWTDLDPMTYSPKDWIPHNGVQHEVLLECFATGKAPENHVVVTFLSPYCGTALVHRDGLVLIDRGLAVGDIVKRNASDSQSGTITNTHLKCRIQPIYTDLPYQGPEPWPHKPEQNELWVPSEELEYWDFQEADYVYFKGWIGQVVDTIQQVKVRLLDGSVVQVSNPDDLRCWAWHNPLLVGSHPNLEASALSSNVMTIRRWQDEANTRNTYNTPANPSASGYGPGQRIHAKNSTLRSGNWLIGQYNANTSNSGIVMQSQVSSMTVDWLTTNMFDPAAAKSSAPSTTVTCKQMPRVKGFNTQIPGSLLGSRRMHEMLPGDLCRFRDEAEAVVRYPTEKALPGFRKIDPDITQGFNMNVFHITASNTTHDIEWQDGSRSTHASTDLIPYVNIDEQDLWPGVAVSVKDHEVVSEGIVKAHRLGIVQSVDAADRIANVRWFINPDISCHAHNRSTIVPGGNCGELSDEITAVSLYEVVEFEAMSKRRGDIVLLSSGADQSSSTLTSWLRAASDLVRGPVLQTQTPEGLPWVGEVVDTRTDGYLVVRLGAMEPPRDVEVRADKVLILVAADTELIDPVEDEDSLEDYESDEMSVDNVVEEIEYEGGERLDIGDDEGWQTDSSENEQPETMDVTPVEDIEMAEVPEATEDTEMVGLPRIIADFKVAEMPQTTEMASVAKIPTSSPAPPSVLSVVDHSEYQFNEYATMPPQFLVLDGDAPADHHFVLHANTPPATVSLKQIRKEHKLLQSGLPRGIWVRTWSNRLDLLRILIIGPRGTPYALAPFVFDFVLGATYPAEPPVAFFHSWTKSMGRINPNLYEDGKVCLSILNTWPGTAKTESWSAEHSSMLQVLVSLLGLVLVERPYYNEAGFEILVGTEDNIVNEKVYSEKALVMSKGFVVHALRNQVPGLNDVLKWVYEDKEGPQLLRWVVDEARKLRDRKEDSSEGKLSRGILIILERHLPALEELLNVETA